MDLNGKRVLITGGSSGIGFALAKAMLANGARVVITGRRADALAEAVDRLANPACDIGGVAADVGTSEGRIATIEGGLAKLGGLDILINNAGVVRAGRLEAVTESDIRTMVEVDLLAPILLTRAALPALRQGRNSLVVQVSSGIGLIGTPFYTTYSAVKAGLAHFGEALRRELLGEGIHVLTVYPVATDTEMMRSSNAGAELGWAREPVSEVADAIVAGIETEALEVIRGGEARAGMIGLNREDPRAVDQRYLANKPAVEEAVRDHSSL
jgi:short-subunit dehydrogenase